MCLTSIFTLANLKINVTLKLPLCSNLINNFVLMFHLIMPESWLNTYETIIECNKRLAKKNVTISNAIGVLAAKLGRRNVIDKANRDFSVKTYIGLVVSIRSSCRISLCVQILICDRIWVAMLTVNVG